MTESTLNIVNGWALYAHPFFLGRLEALTAEVERAAAKNPDGFHHHPSYKLLDAVTENIMVNVPANPAHPNYRQGTTLGKTNKHWLRVKKQGMAPRYRLFFQFRSDAPKTIIYVWLNDESTLRKAGDKSDVYAVFASMIKVGGKVPSAFAELLAASKAYGVPGEALEAEREGVISVKD
ncbi:type II toxin-antitoxin system YhaV family toxin [Pseudomonas sp. LB3P31]